MVPKNLYKLLKTKQKEGFLLISGPCVIEGKDITFKICEKLQKMSDKHKLPFIFKASFVKANRTKFDSFRTIGIDKSLSILEDVKKEFEIPVLTDVHSELDVELVKAIVDVIQIPAFLCRQTDLLEAAGETGKPVNIKKGQFISPYDIKYSAEKVKKAGSSSIMLTERGSTFGYNNLIVDMRSIPIMKESGYPVIFDSTHSVQMPSSEKGVSGGTPQYIPALASAACAAGADGFFIETHPNPKKALSDGSTMVPLDKMDKLLLQIKEFYKVSKKYNK